MSLPADNLLRQKEIHGLYAATFARVFLLLAIGVVVYYSSLPQNLIYEICGTMLFVIFVSLIMIFKVHKSRNPKGAGIFGLILDVLILAGLPLFWYFFLAEKPLPPAALTKTMYPFIWLLILIVQLFSLRPSMVFVIGLSAGLIQAGLLVFTYFDPNTKFSTSLSGISDANTVVITYQAAAILSAIFSGLVGAYIVSSVRNLLVDAEFASGDEVLFTDDTSDARSGTETEAAVLSCEIKNFTAETEGLVAEQIFKVLSMFHRTMGAIVRSHNGKIAANNETLCAAFMFSVGPRRNNGAEQALQAAVKMLESIGELNKMLADNKLPEIEIDIGIHCGTIAVGSLHINGRPVFTLAGETVTFAHRVKNACKSTGVSLLFTGFTKDMLNGSEKYAQPVGSFSVRGKEEKISLYTTSQIKNS